MTDFHGPLAAFDRALSIARAPDAPFDALLDLARATVGVKLFTFMTADMATQTARRSYTSHPQDYPVSGTKPITYNRWFETVHTRRECFVANTLADIATVFPDYELIGRLGCGSVINLPVVLGDTPVGTVNMLHEEQHYTPERVSLASNWLSVPAKAAYLARRALQAAG
ncbi:GAF domain-containing protein [Roseibium salinum]|uniref:GAF domain-containing protein n=1 Tax=Roseibium salinum TaxID=1604349 RepID=A0ABT3R297_9HYPH|nr:GAF domain-containing protein [Roseibium sp. DSM 29163]MCX2723284.1 GAF domain-containing protein [Roseibium sp. DSM 29163]MDN3718807.1 GAF domain-containing protein [Roseibium salinum]